MPIEIEFDGLQQMIDRLDTMDRKGSAIENEALTAAAQPILEDAKSTTQFHDRTGNLREGLKVSGVKKKAGTKYVLVGIQESDNSKVFYGKFFEFGSSKMPARPFLQPAFERNKRAAMDIIKQKLKEGLGL